MRTLLLVLTLAAAFATGAQAAPPSSDARQAHREAIFADLPAQAQAAFARRGNRPRLSTGIVDGPTAISVSEAIIGIPYSAIQAGQLPADYGGLSVKDDLDPVDPALPTIGEATATCGACMVNCWKVKTRSGASDPSGHIYVYQESRWCANGAVVTWATAWQTYDQAGWYTLDSAYGPWFGQDSGGIGKPTIVVSGYILYRWHTPLIGMDTSGTSHLDTTLYAYGKVTT